MNGLSKYRPEHIIYAEDLSMSYGSKVVLDDIDLAISRGELVSIVGPSGCGKSTLLRLLLGEEKPTGGKLFVSGAPVRRPDSTRGIVYQKYSLYPHLTAIENVLLGYRFAKNQLDFFRRRKSLRQEAMHYLEKVGLADHANQFPAQLSGGQQQRVAIAQTLIMKPEILFMDEPYGALDPLTREDLQLFLLQIWGETGMTIIFITHDMTEAVYLGSRVMGLSQFYNEGRKNHGARIVIDLNLGREIKSPEVKGTAEFGQTVRQLHRDCLTRNYRKRVDQFTLVHPDSFMTLTDSQKAKTDSL